MTLTAEDVRNKVFRTVRLRAGYEQVDVDEFLDEVHAAIIQLEQERDAMARELARLRDG